MTTLCGRIVELRCSKCEAELWKVSLSAERDDMTLGYETVCSTLQPTVVLSRLSGEELNGILDGDYEALLDRLHTETGLPGLAYARARGANSYNLLRWRNSLSREERRTRSDPEVLYECPLCTGYMLKQPGATFEDFRSRGGRVITTGNLVFEEIA